MQFKDNQTIYTQIADFLRKDIFRGKYKSGDKLPPIRDMAIYCKVNPNTIVRVYAELEQQNLIYTERTTGKFVTKDVDFLNSEKKIYIRHLIELLLQDLQECNIPSNTIIKIIGEVLDEKK